MISLENIDKFKLLYNDAVSKGNEMFVFEGKDVLTSYAKYVIEHFNNIINARVVELVDTQDLKSCSHLGVRVRFPPRVHVGPVAQLDRAIAF